MSGRSRPFRRGAGLAKAIRINDVLPSYDRNASAQNFSAAAGFQLEWPAAMGDRIMTDDTHQDADGRRSLHEAALEEMAKFERKESEFRKKDRAERAVDLRLPLDEIKVH
ncbi:hypothetical protein XH88_07395 [Bradyrhizobium sp. CCBAU 51627]|nr:hypothetical protein [Bradyrhizobium sp. CCBAU 51627]